MIPVFPTAKNLADKGTDGHYAFICTDFAFIAFALMGALVPAEDAITRAESQLSGHYPSQALADARQTVAGKITAWQEYRP